MPHRFLTKPTTELTPPFNNENPFLIKPTPADTALAANPANTKGSVRFFIMLLPKEPIPAPKILNLPIRPAALLPP